MHLVGPAAATAPSLSDFVLERDNGALQGVVDDLDAQLPKLGVQNILTRVSFLDTDTGRDQRWTVTEHDGKRIVYATPRP